MDKWFVGSSSSSKSGLANSAAARATRTRQPPDRSFIARPSNSSENPKLTSIERARPSAESASMLWRRVNTSASSAAAFDDPSPSPSVSFSRRSCSSRSSWRSTSARSTISIGLTSSLMSARGISCAT
mmetsp:Transcript_68203/g.110682  ORF Transcript_68203/g.110682 Transcript_68203/m.110682 type:complete len:128 (-) Transcript_68203:800-1183(-)